MDTETKARIALWNQATATLRALQIMLDVLHTEMVNPKAKG